MADETATHESARKRAHKEKGPSAFLAAARQALTAALPELIPARWALKGNKSLRAVFFPATKQLEDAGFIAQLWIGRQEGGGIRCSFEVVETTAGNGNNDQRETIAQSLREHLSGQVLPESVQLSAKSTAARLKLKVDVSEDTKENVRLYQGEIDKIVRFVEFLDTALSDWSPSEHSGSPTNETPMLFLRVGWMRDYRGLSNDKIDGGGKFVQKHGYGHEIFNFLPCEGRVFGYVRPKSNKGEKTDGSGIRLERLGARKNDGKLDGVLVVWLSRSPKGGTYIVGWYRNATVYRECQKANKGLNRTFNGEEFGYYVSAAVDNAELLKDIERQFRIPRRKKGIIGQSNVWYADDPALDPEFRRQVLRYVESRDLPVTNKPKQRGTPHQPDPFLRCKVEEEAVRVTTAYFKQKNYSVHSREKDNLGWDLLATCETRELHLEVKGLSGSKICVELTPNEYEQMQKLRDSYQICVVTNALVAPELAVFSYNPDSGQWQDERKRTLEIQSLTGARCRV